MLGGASALLCRYTAVMLIGWLVLALAGATANGAQPMSFALTSPAFAAGGEIPTRYTCEGDDISPPLAWSAPPAGTKSLALIVDDPDAPDPKAPKITWVHWVLYNLPPSADGLPEGGRHGRCPPAPGRG